MGEQAAGRRDRQVLAVFRLAATTTAIRFIADRHTWFQRLAIPLGVLAYWWQWWASAAILGIALLVFLLYRLAVGLIERLGMPRHLREPLKRARRELREEFERLELPTGPLSGGRFAWRLIRGKRPHTDLFARMEQGLDRVKAIIDRAMTDAGLVHGDGPGQSAASG